MTDGVRNVCVICEVNNQKGGFGDLFNIPLNYSANGLYKTAKSKCLIRIVSILLRFIHVYSF